MGANAYYWDCLGISNIIIFIQYSICFISLFSFPSLIVCSIHGLRERRSGRSFMTIRIVAFPSVHQSNSLQARDTRKDTYCSFLSSELLLILQCWEFCVEQFLTMLHCSKLRNCFASEINNHNSIARHQIWIDSSHIAELIKSLLFNCLILSLLSTRGCQEVLAVCEWRMRPAESNANTCRFLQQYSRNFRGHYCN